MWRHEATKRNVARLRGDGVTVLEPEEGEMACGEYGPGRLPEPDAIFAAIEGALGGPGPLAGRHVIVTAGPTHEPIDPVRVIANRSSGKQGFAIAQALAALDARVAATGVPLLLERGGGAIVNFASIAVIRSIMHMSAYSAAKSAVAALTRELAREYRDANIRVNAVAPATVRTADNVAQMGENQPLVELEEVVNTVLFLASDEASAITGQIVPITGKAY